MTMPIRAASEESHNQKMRQPGKVRVLTKGEIDKEYPTKNVVRGGIPVGRKVGRPTRRTP